ncbi:MAG: protein kinase [Polyangiaceae bacterium]
MSLACPPEATLVAYAEGKAPTELRAAIESHMASCSDCRVIVSMLAKSETTAGVDPLASTALAATIMTDNATPPKRVFTPGEIFEGKYRVERLIGVGGMGMVVEATHFGLDRRVAIKFMRHETRDVPEATTRFFREARAVASLSSDHVVRVFDNGIAHDGEPYLVMELLRGEDLAQILEREKRVSPALAARWILEACDAIGEAHVMGVVHRDLKPANLFLAETKPGERKVKVLDFGISKLIGEGAVGGHTSRSVLLGSPRYMSPEQTQSSARTDARTDIWALGVVLYELVTGHPPFDGENAIGLAAAILSQPTPGLKKARPDVPTAFERVVIRCLEKHPNERFQTVRELADVLRPLAAAPKRSAAPVWVGGAIAVIAGAVVALAAWSMTERKATVAEPALYVSPSAVATDAPTASATASTTVTTAIITTTTTAAIAPSTAAGARPVAKLPLARPKTTVTAASPSLENLPGMDDRK